MFEAGNSRIIQPVILPHAILLLETVREQVTATFNNHMSYRRFIAVRRTIIAQSLSAAGTSMYLPARYIVFWTCLISSVWKESARMSCSSAGSSCRGPVKPQTSKWAIRSSPTANDLPQFLTRQEPNRSTRKSAKSLWIITPHLVMVREHKGPVWVMVIAQCSQQHLLRYNKACP